jgi:hypothetical protein
MFAKIPSYPLAVFLKIRSIGVSGARYAIGLQFWYTAMRKSPIACCNAVSDTLLAQQSAPAKLQGRKKEPSENDSFLDYTPVLIEL